MSNDQPFSLPTNGGQQPAGNPYYVEPQQAYDPTYDEFGVGEYDDSPEAVFWNVEGWSPAQPFTGELVFTDESGNYLLSLPVEPEAMRSLNDITGQVLEAQYAAFGQTRSAAAPESGTRETADGRRVIEKDIAGVPLRMSVNMKNLKFIGIAAAFVAVIMVIAVFNG